MAYAFSALNNVIGQQANQNNIFNQNNTANPNQNGQQTTQSSSTNMNSAPPQQPSAPAPVSAQTIGGDQSSATRAAFKANTGKTDQPKALGDIDSQIQNNQQRLQDEANNYTQNQQSKIQQATSYTDGDLDAAAGNDLNAANKIKDLYNSQSAPVERFGATDINIKDADLLGTNEGLKSLVSRGQDENYTGGMASFDLGVLQKDPRFSSLIQGLSGKASALGQQERDLEDQKTNDLQTLADNSYTQAKAGILSGVNTRTNAINQANAQEAAAANQRLVELRQNGNPEAEKAFLNSLSDNVKAKLMAADPKAAALMNTSNINARDYLKVRGDYNANDFVSGDEASRFNNLMSLIGSGGTLAASNPLDPELSFDQSGVEQKLLTDTLAARDVQRTAEQKKADQLAQAAKVKADAIAKKEAETRAAYEAYQAKAAADALAARQEAMKQAQMASRTPTTGIKRRSFSDLFF